MKEQFLTVLRDRSTPCREFRTAARKLASRLLREVEELIEEAPQSSSRIILIPILRAGLAFLEPALEIFPDALVGMIGLFRDEKTAKPHLYYRKVPKLQPGDTVILLDPMLATGGSAKAALLLLREEGADPSRTMIVSIIAAKEGSEAVAKLFPETRQILGAVDPELDAQKFIVPGLGDFGDRYFGTN